MTEYDYLTEPRSAKKAESSGGDFSISNKTIEKDSINNYFKIQRGNVSLKLRMKLKLGHGLIIPKLIYFLLPELIVGSQFSQFINVLSVPAYMYTVYQFTLHYNNNSGRHSKYLYINISILSYG